MDNKTLMFLKEHPEIDIEVKTISWPREDYMQLTVYNSETERIVIDMIPTSIILEENISLYDFLMMTFKEHPDLLKARN